MASAPVPSPQDLLMPGGQPVGSKSSIRQLPGGMKAADEFFDELATGGAPVPLPGYPGRMVDLPDGGRAGLRSKSGSGEPTIDVDIPGIPVKKLKFV